MKVVLAGVYIIGLIIDMALLIFCLIPKKEEDAKN